MSYGIGGMLGENMAAQATGGHGPAPGTGRATTTRNVAMALLGAAVLVLVPMDFGANAAGVGLAVLIDVVTTPLLGGQQTSDGHGSTAA